jgi:hypothetical protein
MPITAQKLGTGTLSLGSGPLDASLQVTGCKVTASEQVQAGEATKVLGGGEVSAPESVSFTYALEGTILQDLIPGGVVAWSWANKGTEQPFTFTPVNGGAVITGVVKPVPLQVGDDEVDADYMDAAFTWRCVGEPVPDWDGS